MSNVTPTEIVSITSQVFGVPEDELRGQFHGGGASWPYFARCCAVLLMGRHTEATQTECARVLGKKVHGSLPCQMRKIANQVEEQVARYPALAGLIEQCEDKIDALHEARMFVRGEVEVAA